jgi:hypothetical protein
MAMLLGVFLRSLIGLETVDVSLSYLAPPPSADIDDEVNLSIDTLGNPASDNSKRCNALSNVSCAWLPQIYVKWRSCIRGILDVPARR